MKTKLFCIREEENWLKYGKVYEATEYFDEEYGMLFVITDEARETSTFTQEPDEDGLDYTYWFDIVTEENEEEVQSKTMWIVVHTDSYYPSVLHFAKKSEAEAWLQEEVSKYDEQDYNCYYLAEVQTHIKGKDFDSELENNDIEWTINR